MRRFFRLGLLLCIFFPLMNLSAEVLSLDKDACISRALANNSDLLIKAISLQTSRRTAAASWNFFLPDISATASASASTSGISISPGVSVSYTFSPGLQEAIRLLKLKLDSNEIGYEDARQQLILKVESEFYYLLTNRNNLEIQQSNIALAQKRYEQTEVKFKNGRASELELLQDKVKLANLKPAYSSLKSAYENRIREFLVVLGIDPLTEVKLAGELEIVDHTFDVDKLIEMSLKNRADILAQQKQLDSLDISLRQARNIRYLPSFSLSASWTGVAQDPFTDGFVYKDNLSASLRLSLGLDDYLPGSAADLKIKEIEDSIAQAKLNQEKLISNAKLQIINLVDSLDTNRENLATSRLNLELSETSYRMTEESFQQGKSDRLILDNAQQNLLTARQNLLESQYQYMKAIITLRGAIGVESLDQME